MSEPDTSAARAAIIEEHGDLIAYEGMEDVDVSISRGMFRDLRAMLAKRDAEAAALREALERIAVRPGHSLAACGLCGGKGVEFAEIAHASTCILADSRAAGARLLEERKRLREALDIMSDGHINMLGDNEGRVCDLCEATSYGKPLVHEPDCPFAALAAAPPEQGER